MLIEVIKTAFYDGHLVYPGDHLVVPDDFEPDSWWVSAEELNRRERELAQELTPIPERVPRRGRPPKVSE